MNVLVLGSGGREHALCSAIASSTHRPRIFVAPGNGGTAKLGQNLALNPSDVEAVTRAVNDHEIDFVIVGPEAPLAAGVTDALRKNEVVVFGPSSKAAQLESSKTFAKRFMRRHNIPTAAFEVFEDANEAKEFIRGRERPVVVKADGLAAGKGVFVADTADEACRAVDECMLNKKFGQAGARVLIEDRISGPEVSFHVVSDGRLRFPLATAQDHKRAYDRDRGPNTGGMGAVSPSPAVDSELEARILRDIVDPTFAGLASEGVEFRGVLFVGLMLTEDGPYVLEYNVRFGDPECQCLLARAEGDWLTLLRSAAQGELQMDAIRWVHPFALSVVIASEGYPMASKVGMPIEGLRNAARTGVQIAHAGTKREGSALLTSGGRVMTVTGVGSSLRKARTQTYEGAGLVRFRGAWFRGDIGHWGAPT